MLYTMKLKLLTSFFLFCVKCLNLYNEIVYFVYIFTYNNKFYGIILLSYKVIQGNTKESVGIEMSTVNNDKKVRTSMWLDEKLLNKVKNEAKRRKRSIAFIVNEKIRKSYEKK